MLPSHNSNLVRFFNFLKHYAKFLDLLSILLLLNSNFKDFKLAPILIKAPPKRSAPSESISLLFKFICKCSNLTAFVRFSQKVFNTSY